MQPKGCEHGLRLSNWDKIAFGLHRPCGVNAAKAIRQEVWSKRYSPFAKSVNINNTKYYITMATAIRAIPTLYGETAKSFESEAKRTEQNPGTQDYCHEAKVVSDFLKTTNVL